MTSRTQTKLWAWTRREERDSDQGKVQVWSAREKVSPGFGHREVTGVCGVLEVRARWLGVRRMGDSRGRTCWSVFEEAWI